MNALVVEVTEGQPDSARSRALHQATSALQHASVPTRAPTMSEAAPELSLEEKKAAKRKEIEERLAGLKLQQEKEASQKTMYFGEHPGITCDGCGACPMVGYRYKCKQAPAATAPAQHPSHRLRCWTEPPLHMHMLR